jgi:asparagine synthase (glutamine-hydrolysing)
MCGIAGVFDYRSTGFQISPDVFDEMVDVLAHRGPDGRGVWCDAGIALGHRRLAILDPTESGAQPMSDSHNRYQLTYNGEIYNYRELKKELTALGHSFKTNCDTEVILAAYAEWGREAVRRFNGIFAFALYDRNQKLLWLVRDRLGVKPLYYSTAGNVVRFASEIKSILADPQFVRLPNPRGLSTFLSFGYVADPETGFKGVFQLPPAHEAVIQNGSFQLYKYWSLSMQTIERSSQEAEAEFSRLLSSAVEQQLVSDVPLGAFLSGGVDSAAIVAEMKSVANNDVHTFSAGFRSSSFDESDLAAETANRIGTNRHRLTADMNLEETVQQMSQYCDGPFADSSSLAVYHLCKVTSENVTVALSGDGADELLAGYSTYRAGHLASVYRHLPKWLRASCRKAALSLPISDSRYNTRQFAERFVLGAEEPVGRDFSSWRVYLRDSDKRSLCKADFFSADDSPLDDYAAHYLNAPDATSPLKRMLHADLTYYLPNDMLVKVDRMSMAHGLEVRVPFLDHELVEFCASLPDRFLMSRFRPSKNKIILRKHLSRKIGPGISSRKKTGFNVPIEQAMRDELYPLFQDAVQNSSFASDGPFQTEDLLAWAQAHRNREIESGHALFGILMLALWWDRWF